MKTENTTNPFAEQADTNHGIEEKSRSKTKTIASVDDTLTQFDSLPNAAHVRLPVVKGLLGCSSATVWRRVKAREIPEPKKFGGRITAWNVGELRRTLSGADKGP